MEENTLSVLKIAPGQYPQQVEIDNDLKALQQTVAQFQKGFRLMEKLLVLPRHLRDQGCKILLAQTHHEKSPGNGIVHLPVFIPQGTVQRQTHELAVVVVNVMWRTT